MNRDALPIPTPCAADWTTMTLSDRSRFCGACQKHVHELSRLTEREARALLASRGTEGLCVRYLHDERGEIVFRKTADLVPVSRLARMKRVAVAATAMATLSLPVVLEGCMASVATEVPVVTPNDDEGRYTATMGEPAFEPPVQADGGADAKGP